MRLVDLSHVIDHQMFTYPGLPGPQIGEHLSFDASHEHYAAGTEFAIGRITMVANTGTYLETPAHRFRDGLDLSELPLEHCANVPAVLVDGVGPVGVGAFSDVPVAGAAVLLRTGWDRPWGTERYADPEHPHGAARPKRLVGMAVEMDCLFSIDTDAYAPGQLDWQPCGCERAEECGVPEGSVLNASTAEDLLVWTGRKR